MKQGMLPLVPSGASRIAGPYGVHNDGTTVTWLLGGNPTNAHAASDHATQRAMVAALHVHAGIKQGRLAAALGLHPNTVRSAVELFRRKGAAGFYEPTAVRGPAVMTPEVLAECRRLLEEGRSRSEVAEEVGVKKANIDKAIQKGRLPDSARKRAPAAPAGDGGAASTSSARGASDLGAASEMGLACTRVAERALAACGLLGEAESRFEPHLDVACGGVLCALPALAANGLLEHLDVLGKLKAGFYGLAHVVVLLAFMALLRIKTVEALRREQPGELGKLLGLDRIPEVRCLRAKLKAVAAEPDAVSAWAAALSRQWMQADPDMAGTLYVDGHTRVYNGSKTKLPRRYAARQRLCLRGVTDYWVNDREGKPFFYVDRPVDNGLLGALREEIVPRLLRDVPGQPSEAELLADPLLPRFTTIFDRAGSSPVFLIDMWRKYRIACMTYRKGKSEDWNDEEFHPVEVRLANGATVTMDIAERGVQIGGEKDPFWCREFRRRGRGRNAKTQTAILSTNFGRGAEASAAAMFARWGQENFFRYMLQDFDLDGMGEHATESFPCRIPVPNPARKALDAECRSLRGKIAAANARLGALELRHDDLVPGKVEAWIESKSALVEDIRSLQEKLDAAKAARRPLPTHIPFDQLPEEHKFECLAPTRKLLLDTVKMTAYRAEMAMLVLARPHMASPEEAHALAKAMFRAAADIRPDVCPGELHVVLHPLAEPRLNRAAAAVLAQLNDAEMTYPGTDLKIVYRMTQPDVPEA